MERSPELDGKWAWSPGGYSVCSGWFHGHLLSCMPTAWGKPSYGLEDQVHTVCNLCSPQALQLIVYILEINSSEPLSWMGIFLLSI